MTIPRVSTFRLPKEVLSGEGASARTGAMAGSLGISRALLVTDRTVRETGCIDAVLHSLDVNGVEIVEFTAVSPEPSFAVVNEAASLARTERCDGVIAAGGGSSLDTAKGAAVLSGTDARIEELLRRGDLASRGLPSIMVPTTAGTGSEVTGIAIYTDESRELKVALASPNIVPDAAIVDPIPTLTVPRTVTAHTGLDALVHAIEAFVSRNATPQTDALAQEAIRLISGSIRRAVADGTDVHSRSAMASGSLMAGMAFANAGVAAAHALAYPLGAKFHLAHGLCTAILLPHVMQASWIGNPEKYRDVLRLLGIRDSAGSTRTAALSAAQAVSELVTDCGVPARLGDVGVDDDAIPSMSVTASQIQRLLKNNPRQLDATAIEGIYRAAM